LNIFGVFRYLCCAEAADPWTVTADDRMKYDAQFYQLQPVAGFLSGTLFDFCQAWY